MRTPKNIIQHELIGLDCEVRQSLNQSQLGIHGRIIDETMKTLLLKTGADRKRVQKGGSIFRLKLDNAKVDVDGDYLVSRSEDRIKKKIKKW